MLLIQRIGTSMQFLRRPVQFLAIEAQINHCCRWLVLSAVIYFRSTSYREDKTARYTLD